MKKSDDETSSTSTGSTADDQQPPVNLRGDWERLKEVLRFCAAPHPMVTEALQQFAYLDHLWHSLTTRWVDTRLNEANEVKAEIYREDMQEAGGINLDQRRGVVQNLPGQPASSTQQTESVRRILDDMDLAWNLEETRESTQIFDNLQEIATQRKLAAERYGQAIKFQEAVREQEFRSIRKLFEYLQANLPANEQSEIQNLAEWVTENLEQPIFQNEGQLTLTSQSAIDEHKKTAEEAMRRAINMATAYEPLPSMDDIQRRMDWYREQVNFVDEQTRSQHRAGDYDQINRDLMNARRGLQRLTSPEGKAATIKAFASMPSTSSGQPSPSPEERWAEAMDNLLHRISRQEAEIDRIEDERRSLVIDRAQGPEYLRYIDFMLGGSLAGRDLLQQWQEIDRRQEQNRDTLSTLLPQVEQAVERGETLLAAQAANAYVSAVSLRTPPDTSRPPIGSSPAPWPNHFPQL